MAPPPGPPEVELTNPPTDQDKKETTTMKSTTKRYVGPAAVLAVGASMFLIGSTQAAPGDPEPIPPIVEVEPAPADWQPTYPDQAVNDWQTDGYAVYGPDTFPTLPDVAYDECWSNDGTTKLASGEFVMFGPGDPTWGTHSIGGTGCGPASLLAPAPEPAPVSAQLAAVPAYDPASGQCG